MTALWRWTLRLALGSAAALPVGCSLIMQYDEVPAGSGPGGAGGSHTCTSPEQCDDQDDCTDNLCEEGQCAYPTAPDQTPCEDGDGNSGVCVAGVCTIGCNGENADIVCDDHNACTDDTCDLTTNECTHEAVPDAEAPGAEQIPGDCALILCAGGEEQQIIDDTDLPNDGNECTVDECNQGVATNEPVALGTECSDGDNPDAVVCDDQGECVECNGPADCDHLPADDECQTRTCMAGECGQDFTAPGTPITAQQLGDCQEVVCDGSGGTQSEDDNGDVPVDNNDCTDDLCTNGSPSNPNEPANTPCGAQGTLYCDGQGICAGCTNNSQCPTDVFCRDHFCNQGTHNCDYNDTANNTPLPSQDQTSGDCQELQCNGSGGVKSVAASDPFVDGNECTSDLCMNGTPVNSPRPVNYSCSQNGGSYCDGNGSCVECNSANQCPTAPDCQYETCSNNSCGTGNESSSTPAPSAYQTAGDCQTVVCSGSGSVNGGVAENSDLPNDNNECTTDTCQSGTPTHTPKADGTTCTQDGQYCTGVEECQSGVCTNGPYPCDGPDGDGDCSEECNEISDSCTSNDPNGSPCDFGTGAGSGTCTNGSCDFNCGFMPPHVPTTCPGVCSSCSGDECFIDCAGEQACQNQNINCPPGWRCHVECVGKEACRYAHVGCPLDFECHVLCDEERACRNLDVQCGTFGPCILECASGNLVCDGASQTCGYNLCHAICMNNPWPGTTCGPSCDCMPCP